jgi:hypothetical protein
MELSGQLHAAAALPPGKEPLVGVLVGPRAVLHAVAQRINSSSVYAGNRTQVDKPVASYYTD